MTSLVINQNRRLLLRCRTHTHTHTHTNTHTSQSGILLTTAFVYKTKLLLAFFSKCEDMIERLCYTQFYWQLYVKNVRT